MSSETKKEPFFFLAVPAYGGIVPLALYGLTYPSEKYRWLPHVESTSATGQTFNCLWCTCINSVAEHGFSHFILHHADIESPIKFADMMLEEMERVGADVLSTIVPIKDDRGLTSSGWMDPKTRVMKRFTMREVMQLPETFDASMLPDYADVLGQPKESLANQWLMVNTGLFIARIDAMQDFPGFNMITGVAQNPDGKWTYRFLPEDWNWSIWMAQKGLRVFQTRKVHVRHYDGIKGYNNFSSWGTWEHDQDDQPNYPAKLIAPTSPPAAPAEPRPKELRREIVAVRYAESMAWVHGWLDDVIVKHGPGLQYRIYDKGPNGDTPNIGNLDWTYLHHIVTRWDDLADWTIFTQADPFPHLKIQDKACDFAWLLSPRGDANLQFPFFVTCKEWGDDGRLRWSEFEGKWRNAYQNGTIMPARLNLVEWFKEFLDVDITKMDGLTYHPGAIFAASREAIQKRPKAFYERLLANLGEGGHRSPESAHYLERGWPIVLGATIEGK